jgi:hypothetical protein
MWASRRQTKDWQRLVIGFVMLNETSESLVTYFKQKV